jgi:hypothetical protein
MQGALNLLEQAPDLRAIIDIAAGQLRGEDLSRLRVNPDVQPAPGSAPAGAVFLDQPVAGLSRLLTVTSRYHPVRTI